jgi:hypothetical protein
VTLDIDDTCDVVHGNQQLALFNAHYDERCFLRRDKAALLQRVQGPPGTAPAGSNRGRHGGDEMSEALG